MTTDARSALPDAHDTLQMSSTLSLEKTQPSKDTDNKPWARR
nr:MAG TPA: hypothetical protein [Caudoviricetes sp.]